MSKIIPDAPENNHEVGLGNSEKLSLLSTKLVAAILLPLIQSSSGRNSKFLTFVLNLYVCRTFTEENF